MRAPGASARESPAIRRDKTGEMCRRLAGSRRAERRGEGEERCTGVKHRVRTAVFEVLL